MIDTHCHLDAAEFDADRDRVAARAAAAGVATIVVPAVERANFGAVASVCREYPACVPAYGIHPLYVAHACEDDLAALRTTLLRERPVAVGEIGLDYFRDLSPRDAQARCFEALLDVARRVGKPVLVHCRDAHADVLATLAAGRVGDAGGIMHCFSGDADVARRCLDLGLTISVAGPVTYPNARALPDVVRLVPADRLVVETDCPYLPPQPYRGKRNEPAYVAITAARVAELRGERVEDLGPLMAANARRLFRLA